MIDLLDRILAFIANKFSEAPITAEISKKNMPPNSWTEMVSITLKAKRRYLIFGRAGTANTAQATSNASIYHKSGSAAEFMEMSQGGFISSSGHSIVALAYIETTTECVITLRKYNYTSAAYSGGNGQMVAIPVLSGGVINVGFSMLLAFSNATERRWEYARQNTGLYCEQNSSNAEQHQRFSNCKSCLEKRHFSRRKYNMDEYGLRYKRRNTQRLQIIRGLLRRNGSKFNYLLSMPKEWRKNCCCSIQKLGKCKPDNIASNYSYLHKRFITNDWGCLAC